jgi:hypothetical protein
LQSAGETLFNPFALLTAITKPSSTGFLPKKDLIVAIYKYLLD